MPNNINKVQAQLKTAVFGQLKSKPLESLSEMPDNTLDNNGTKHLVIIDPHNCLEYHINDADPYSDLDFQATHNFGGKSQNKRTGTYSRGNFARLYDYYSGKVVNQKEEPDSRRMIFSRRGDHYATREIDLSETKLTEMAEIKEGWLVNFREEYFLQDRYSSHIDTFFKENGFKNVVLYSNGAKVDPNDVRGKSSFPFRIPSKGKNMGKLKESTADQLELVVDQFFITNRFIKPDTNFQFRIVVLNKEGEICFEKESNSNDGFDWTFGKSYTEEDLREQVDTGWLRDDNGVEIRICLDLFKFKSAEEHVPNYAGCSSRSKNKSITKNSAPSYPSTMYCLVTEDKQTGKVTKFQGRKFPVTSTCLEQVGCSTQHGDGYSSGTKETVFYNTAFARESGVSQSGIKNNFDPDYQLIQDILKSNNHSSGVSWYFYLQHEITEHRRYNKNWKSELVIRENEEAAKQIAEADLSYLVEQEEVVDEIIEVDLDDLVEQEEVVDEITEVDLGDLVEQEEAVDDFLPQGSPKGPAVNRNTWGSFSIGKESKPGFIFPSSKQEIPFWYERRWDTSSEKYEDFIMINTASDFADEWSENVNTVLMVRAFAEILREQFSSNPLTRASFLDQAQKEKGDITYQTYQEFKLEQIIKKTSVTRRTNITVFDILEQFVNLKVKLGV